MHFILPRVDVCSDIFCRFSRETYSTFNKLVFDYLEEGERETFYKCASDCECERCEVSCTCISVRFVVSYEIRKHRAFVLLMLDELLMMQAEEEIRQVNFLYRRQHAHDLKTAPKDDEENEVRRVLNATGCTVSLFSKVQARSLEKVSFHIFSAVSFLTLLHHPLLFLLLHR